MDSAAADLYTLLSATEWSEVTTDESLLSGVGGIVRFSLALVYLGNPPHTGLRTLASLETQRNMLSDHTIVLGWHASESISSLENVECWVNHS